MGLGGKEETVEEHQTFERETDTQQTHPGYVKLLESDVILLDGQLIL